MSIRAINKKRTSNKKIEKPTHKNGLYCETQPKKNTIGFCHHAAQSECVCERILKYLTETEKQQHTSIRVSLQKIFHIAKSNHKRIRFWLYYRNATCLLRSFHSMPHEIVTTSNTKKKTKQKSNVSLSFFFFISFSSK